MSNPLVVYYSSLNEEVIHNSDTFPIKYNNSTIPENLHIEFYSWLGEWYGTLYEKQPRDYGGLPLIGGLRSDKPPYSSAASTTAVIARPFFDKDGAAESQGYLALHISLDRSSSDTALPAGTLKVFYYSRVGLRKDINIYIPALTLTNDNPLIILYPSDKGSTFYDKNLKVLARQNPAEDVGNAKPLTIGTTEGKVNYYHSMEITNDDLSDDAEFLTGKYTSFVKNFNVNGVLASPSNFDGLKCYWSGDYGYSYGYSYGYEDNLIVISAGVGYAGGYRIELIQPVTINPGTITKTKLIVIEYDDEETDPRVDEGLDETYYVRKVDLYKISIIDTTMKQTYQLVLATLEPNQTLTDIRSFVPRVYNSGNNAYLTIVKKISGQHKMFGIRIEDVAGSAVVSPIQIVS